MKMEDTPPPADDLLGSELRDQLFARVVARLHNGEVLVANAHFQRAFEEEYQVLTGAAPGRELKEQLAALIQEVNKKTPEVLVVAGVENWIIKAFMEVVRKNNWNVVLFQENGHQALREFMGQDRVRALLAQLQLRPVQLNLSRCLRSAANLVAGKGDLKPKRVPRFVPLGGQGPPPEAAEQVPETLKQYLAGPAAEPTEEEAQQRTQEQQKLQAQIRDEQLDHLFQNLDSYLQQGKFTQEEAERFGKVYQVERAVKAGKLQREKGDKIRNSLLAGTARFEFDRKVRAVTDYAVCYLQLFAALKRIEAKYDDGLRFLIRYKEVVNADREQFAPEEVVHSLAGDSQCLKLLTGLMDRQDAEVRMMIACLAPYSYVVRKGQEQRIERLTIEERFIDELRQLSRAQMSQRLNAPDRAARSRPAADMVCLIALINRLVKPTPFRKEIRLLKVDMIVEEFYRSTDDLGEARVRAQRFLKTRLRTLYPDLTPDEFQEIEVRGAQLIDRVEQKISAERQAASKATEAEEGGKTPQFQDSLALNEKEVARGAQIGRVAMRVAGNWRTVPCKIMPDRDDASRFVLAQRDPKTGELVVAMRRGNKRYVEKNREGIWEQV